MLYLCLGQKHTQYPRPESLRLERSSKQSCGGRVYYNGGGSWDTAK